MKWKRWVRNLSVSGPRVAVRPQLPWHVRALLAALALGIAFAAGLAVRTMGPDTSTSAASTSALSAEVERLRVQLTQAVAERDREAAAAVNWESRLTVERSAQERVAAQMKALEEENARIRSDLAFFESLLPTPASAKGGVVIRSFRVQPEGDGNALRYRLLVQQSGRPERDFVGDVSLIFNVLHDGREEALKLPDPAAPAAGPTPLSFRHYQRVEGTLGLPVGATVRSVLVRIHSNGETRAQQTFVM